MVRALVVGVGDFPEPQVGEDELADGAAVLEPLASVGPAVGEFASALARVGVATAGDALLECDREGFWARWRALRQSAGRGEGLVVHFAGHGIRGASGGLYLAAAGATDRDGQLVDTCVSFGQLLEEANDCGRPVLFLLDVCQAGQALVQQQVAELVADTRQDIARTVWIIGACAADAVAYGAGFTTAAAEVLQQLVDGDLDVTPTLEYVPVETLAEAVDRHLARGDRAAGRPRRAVMRTAHPTAAPEPAPFFRNPAHTAGSDTGLLARLDPRLRAFALGCAPGLDPLHFATRAAGNPAVDEILFTGRRSQLARIQSWIDQDSGDQGRLLAVTGGPGSGKSALLGVGVCLLHPDLEPLLGRRVGNAVDVFEPRRPGTVLAVHARQLTVQQITDALRGQLRRQHPQTPSRYSLNMWPVAEADALDPPGGTGLGQLLRDLHGADDVLIVLDALDEAADPAAVAAELLLPLARTGRAGPGARILVGTRPWWDILPALHEYLAAHPESRLDLDPATDADRKVLAEDLEGYLRKLLPRRHPARKQVRAVAQRLARYADHGAFLVAALYANYLITTLNPVPAEPPSTVTEVFDLHLAALARNDPWIHPVLAAVGRARGQGMPADLIHAVAAALQPADPARPAQTLADTRRALAKAAFYLRTTPGTDQRLLYRYFHQALAEHTETGTDPVAVHIALTATVPLGDHGTPDWAHAQPYLLRYAAGHAHNARGGAMDRLLADWNYLVHADPDTLAPYLHHATAEQAVLHADIYRSTAAHHADRHHTAARRDLLILDALAWWQPDIAHALTAADHSDSKPFTPRWATRSTHSARRHTLTGHPSGVNAVAIATGLDGTPLAVTADQDGIVMVWDLVAGTARHTLIGHTRGVSAVAVTAGQDGTVTLGDLAAETVRRALIGHTRGVSAVAVTTGPDGTPLAVTAGDDGFVMVWDLVAGTARHTLTGHPSGVNAVAIATGLDGTPLAVTADQDGIVMVWDLVAGTARHTLTGHTRKINAVAVAVGPDGTPLAVTAGDDGIVMVWDLVAGTARHTLTGHTRKINAVAVAVGPDGTPLAVTAGDDGTVIVWDLVAGTARHTLTGHTRKITTIAVATGLDGTPLAVTASGHNRIVMVWDLATGTARHTLTGHSGQVVAVAAATGPEGTPLAVTAGHDGTVIVWNLTAGTARHTLTGHTSGVNAIAVVTDPDGTPLAVTAGYDTAVIVWDLGTRARRHIRTGHTGEVLAVAVVTGPEGTPLAITTSWDDTVIVWDLTAGTIRNTLTGHTDFVRAVAVVTDPDGTPLAVTAGDDSTVIVWDLATGAARHTMTGQTGMVHAAAIVTGLDDTPLAVTSDYDGAVVVWDLVAGAAHHTLTGHTGMVDAVAIAIGLDGTPLAVTAGQDGTVMVWDLAAGTARHTLTGHTDWVSAVATVTGRDGTPLAVTTSHDGTVMVWDLVAGTVHHTLTGHTSGVNAVAIATGLDGTPLAVTAGQDGTVMVWDLAAGTARHTLTGHTDWVSAVAIVTGRDGTPLAVTTSHDGTVIVWDLSSGEEMFRFYLPYGGNCVYAAGTGFLIAYGPEVAYFT